MVVMPWVVRMLPEARAELQSLVESEREAIENAMAKLEALGLALRFPHCSYIQDSNKIWELRPRAGKSPWRAFYRQLGQAFVVASVGPEAKVSPRDFKRAVTAAEGRLDEVGMRLMVKIDELPTLQDVLDDEFKDPAFKARWDRGAFAREVAIQLIRYRAEHDLTQTALARAVGMKQSAIARLEIGEQPPSLATLARLTAKTGIEFRLSVRHGEVVFA